VHAHVITRKRAAFAALFDHSSGIPNSISSPVTLTRADDLKTIQLAVADRAIIMAANIASRKELAGNIKDHHDHAAKFHIDAVPIGHIGYFADRIIGKLLIGHGYSSSSSISGASPSP
jgi:hypothetical protein